MDFPSNLFNENKNPLPYDGDTTYFNMVFSEGQSNAYFNRLLNTIEWRNDELIMFGKRIVTKRKTAWYGEKPFQYSYSNTTKTALPWTKELMEIKAIIEAKTNRKFNSCLLNLYHNGEEGMGWHSDDEPEMKKNEAIASVSFGVPRKFVLRHKKTKEKIELILENGSVLIMEGDTQTHWQHAIPKTKKIDRSRINLTFRTFIEG